jgi:hypothetical protein
MDKRQRRLSTRCPPRRPTSYQTKSPATACEGEGRREPQTEVTGAGQGTGTEEQRLSRHRWHELLDDHRAKEGRIAVRTNEDVQTCHMLKTLYRLDASCFALRRRQ